MLVYLCSTLYRWAGAGRKRGMYFMGSIMRRSFTLVSLRGPVGWILFGLVWTLAVAGVVFKSFAVGRFAAASAIDYRFHGWVVIFAVHPLIHAINPHGLLWLGAGGLAYTLGIVFSRWIGLPASTLDGKCLCWQKRCALLPIPFYVVKPAGELCQTAFCTAIRLPTLLLGWICYQTFD